MKDKIVKFVKAVCSGTCSHCGGSGWIGDIKCPACS
jgi:DnaJ-class molecular chaperone